MHVKLMAIPLLFCCIFLESVLAVDDFQAATSHLLECRLCRNALYLEECRETQLCSSNEECYMDLILTSQLQLIFNGGCRSKMVCRAGAAHTGKRAITDFVICSSCCNVTTSANTTECNVNLCGLKSKTMNPPSSQCYSCGDDVHASQGAVTDPSHCRTINVCADNEVCRTTTKNTGGIITYEFGCYQLLQCQILTITSLESQGVNTGVDLPHLIGTGELVGRKRQTIMCDVCCGNGLCNDDECQSVRTRLSLFAMAGRFNYTSLKLIR